MKINLSPKQQKIVDHDDGAILVKAGPGSGKTRVLIERTNCITCYNNFPDCVFGCVSKLF